MIEAAFLFEGRLGATQVPVFELSVLPDVVTKPLSEILIGATDPADEKRAILGFPQGICAGRGSSYVGVDCIPC